MVGISTSKSRFGNAGDSTKHSVAIRCHAREIEELSVGGMSVFITIVTATFVITLIKGMLVVNFAGGRSLDVKHLFIHAVQLVVKISEVGPLCHERNVFLKMIQMR